MKKRFFLAMAAVAVSVFCVQRAQAWGVDWGFSGGVSNSMYRSSDVDVVNKMGGHAGASIRVKLGAKNKWAVGPEFMWSYNRLELNDVPLTVNLYQMPVTVGWRPVPFFRLNAGPVFTLSGKTSSKDNIPWPMLHSSVGYTAGVEFKFWFLQLWLRYNGQFAKRETYLPASTSTPFKIGYSSLNLGIGFAF